MEEKGITKGTYIVIYSLRLVYTTARARMDVGQVTACVSTDLEELTECDMRE